MIITKDIHSAEKYHFCHGCGTIIQPSESYQSRIIIEHQFLIHKWCVGCISDMELYKRGVRKQYLIEDFGHVN